MCKFLNKVKLFSTYPLALYLFVLVAFLKELFALREKTRYWTMFSMGQILKDEL